MDFDSTGAVGSTGSGCAVSLSLRPNSDLVTTLYDVNATGSARPRRLRARRRIDRALIPMTLRRSDKFQRQAWQPPHRQQNAATFRIACSELQSAGKATHVGCHHRQHRGLPHAFADARAAAHRSQTDSTLSTSEVPLAVHQFLSLSGRQCIRKMLPYKDKDSIAGLFAPAGINRTAVATVQPV